MASTDLIGWFADIGLADRPTVGGKGGSLGELTRASIAVPAGFVVRTASFERCVNELERTAPVAALVESLAADDLEAIARAAVDLRRRVEGAVLPEEVCNAIRTAHSLLGDSPVAVRSSATTEDAEDASFAGLQDTYLWVIGAEAVVAAVQRCWASLYSVESLSYRRRKGLAEKGVAMAVVVQRMVNSRTAGVMFTRSPTTGDKSVIVIEGAWGLGSAVVSGEVTPDRFVLGKITGEISVRDISDKHIRHLPLPDGGTREEETPTALRNAPCVTDEDLQRLRELGRRVERHYGRPQDIEWAIDQEGQVLILQSRPETVWSAREAAPVAAIKDNPLHHVMSVFGGQAVSLTAKDVAEIQRLLEESRFDELTLEMNGVKLHLRRGKEGASRSSAPAPGHAAGESQAPAPASDAKQALAATASNLAAPAGSVSVPAPLLGIFYRAPKPGEPPFVAVGSKVGPDTLIGIIEVMKLMTTVRAGVSGEVLRIDARDGELVEFGESLLFVKP